MKSLRQRLGIPRFQADERYVAGLAAFVTRDRETSVQEIESAIELLPDHAEYHAALGLVLLDIKRTKDARDCFERALHLNRYEMLANYGLGVIAYRAKKWPEALDKFAAAHAAQPRRAETLYYLAMVYHRLGRNVEALEWMGSASTAFSKLDDRREAQCSAWMREFQKLLETV